NVHMDRKIALVSETSNLFQVFQRHCADAVWSHTDPSHITQPCQIGLESFDAFQVDLWIAFDEANLTRVCFSLETRTSIGDTQQSDSYTHILRGANDLFGNEVRIIVRNSLGVVVNVVKLSNS